jgi:hypothetical protein
MPWEWAVLARWALSAEAMPRRRNALRTPTAAISPTAGRPPATSMSPVPATVPEDSSTGDGDEAAALGQAGQPGDVVRAGRAGQLVSVVLDGGDVRQVGFADGLADGDPGG